MWLFSALYSGVLLWSTHRHASHCLAAPIGVCYWAYQG